MFQKGGGVIFLIKRSNSMPRLGAHSHTIAVSCFASVLPSLVCPFSFSPPATPAMNSDLPSHSSAVEEKLERQHRSHASNAWTRPVSLAIPGVRTRRLRIFVPNAGPFRGGGGRMRKKRGPMLVALACLAVFFTVILVTKSFGRSDWSDQWQGNTNPEPPTLVFMRRELQKIWKWEIASGHYPSRASSVFSKVYYERYERYSSLRSTRRHWLHKSANQPSNPTTTTSQQA